MRAARFAAVTVALIAAAGTAFAAGQVGKWREGVHYQLLPQPPQAPQRAGDTVRVHEIFWYGCGHCYALDPVLEAWDAEKADYIEFVRLPVIWGPMHRQHAKLFYTLKALGKLDLHPKVFDAIHKEHLPLADNNEATAREMHFGFLKRHGVTRAEFDAAYDSQAVADDLELAERVTLAYRVDSVPTIFVNRRYSAGVTVAGGPEQLIELINDLAASEKNR